MRRPLGKEVLAASAHQKLLNIQFEFDYDQAAKHHLARNSHHKHSYCPDKTFKFKRHKLYEHKTQKRLGGNSSTSQNSY